MVIQCTKYCPLFLSVDLWSLLYYMQYTAFVVFEWGLAQWCSLLFCSGLSQCLPCNTICETSVFSMYKIDEIFYSLLKWSLNEQENILDGMELWNIHLTIFTFWPVQITRIIEHFSGIGVCAYAYHWALQWAYGNHQTFPVGIRRIPVYHVDYITGLANLWCMASGIRCSVASFCDVLMGSVKVV